MAAEESESRGRSGNEINEANDDNDIEMSAHSNDGINGVIMARQWRQINEWQWKY